MQRVVYYNKNLIKEGEAVLSPFNRGLHYGDGVFETLRAYSGEFFRFEDHMNRLLEGLKLLKIATTDWDRAEICIAAKAVLRANKLRDAAVKVLAFRQGVEGPAPPPGLKASVLVTAASFDHKKKLRYEKGISAHVVSGRRNKYSPVTFIKSLNYLDNILGRLEARDMQADEALFLNTDGKVAEGATSNIFIVKDGILLTPPVNAGILKGITREVVLRIASQTGLQYVEENFSSDEFFGAQEAFLTNSLMEIMPLVAVNGKAISKGVPGDVTRQLMRQYGACVKEELKVSP